MRDFKQLLLFELTEDEFWEIVGLLEFDFVRFPPPFVGVHTKYEMEVKKWISRSDKIERFVKSKFKIV